MKTQIKTGIAVLMLLAISCTKESKIQSSVKTDDSLNSSVKTNLTVVTIGTQTWMTKDLATSTYRNGDKIPQVKNSSQWATLTTGAWCYYNNNPHSGKLYNWYAVNDPRGLAPAGWHIPSDVEWTTLTIYLGGVIVAGGKMKETGTAHWWTPNADATNSSGFTALPGGTRYYLGDFFDAGGYGYWWRSTEAASNAAYYRHLTYFYGTISAGTDYKTNGFSVRCLKD